MCCGQEWMRNASVYFFMTACFERTMWRYRFSRAYRVLLMDAGHLGQTFQLVATGLGLNSFVTAAILDESVEKALGIDRISENALYCGAVGYVHEPVSYLSKVLPDGHALKSDAEDEIVTS